MKADDVVSFILGVAIGCLVVLIISTVIDPEHNGMVAVASGRWECAQTPLKQEWECAKRDPQRPLARCTTQSSPPAGRGGGW